MPSSLMSGYGWNNGEFRCLVDLWNRESNWLTSAMNPYSGAYGIPQSLPGDKMAAAGSDWRTNYRTQIHWGLSYISAERTRRPVRGLGALGAKGLVLKRFRYRIATRPLPFAICPRNCCVQSRSYEQLSGTS